MVSRMAAVTQSNNGKKTMPDEELPDEAPAVQPEPSREAGTGGTKGPTRGAARPAGAGGPSFFTIHKKGQGYWTRMGTAIGAGALGVMLAFELYYKIPTFLHGGNRDNKIALGVAIGFLIAYALWAFWYTNKPTTVDFLVATDSEMKKVNWTTRKELIGSTKIVILFMLMIAIYLFACDLLFGGFFKLIHVLKTWF